MSTNRYDMDSMNIRRDYLSDYDRCFYKSKNNLQHIRMIQYNYLDKNLVSPWNSHPVEKRSLNIKMYIFSSST